MREDQALGLAHKKVLLVDDVLSTGETLKAAKKLITQVGGTVRAVAVLAIEGEKRGALFEGCPLSYVCHLPLYQKR
ncbi:phosphoribosyltransferase family protein [Candidatus Hepatobacter penaei]|uniref:phosphoribosyltransferase family protein n=1 Tax=Candidatus Hepatobacter penaei TaxID=1274402 RepID=UPI0004F370CE|nr:phosphoribosyltransferase family protein [Candidatus Hepatobacter penaei]